MIILMKKNSYFFANKTLAKYQYIKDNIRYCNIIRTTTMAFYTYIYAPKQAQLSLV